MMKQPPTKRQMVSRSKIDASWWMLSEDGWCLVGSQDGSVVVWVVEATRNQHPPNRVSAHQLDRVALEVAVASEVASVVEVEDSEAIVVVGSEAIEVGMAEDEVVLASKEAAASVVVAVEAFRMVRLRQMLQAVLAVDLVAAMGLVNRMVLAATTIEDEVDMAVVGVAEITEAREVSQAATANQFLAGVTVATGTETEIEIGKETAIETDMVATTMARGNDNTNRTDIRKTRGRRSATKSGVEDSSTEMVCWWVCSFVHALAVVYPVSIQGKRGRSLLQATCTERPDFQQTGTTATTTSQASDDTNDHNLADELSLYQDGRLLLLRKQSTSPDSGGSVEKHADVTILCSSADVLLAFRN